MSKKQLKKLGSKLRKEEISESEAKDIVQSFREKHLLPMEVMKQELERKCSDLSYQPRVATRLKQLATIIDKLKRPSLHSGQPNQLSLDKMQDIAGCRIIRPSQIEVIRLLKSLQQGFEYSNQKKISDYFTKPKDSGYGGIHVIYETTPRDTSDKYYVEVQLRTKLQHSWATSLEIIDTFEQLNLKHSLEGYDEWRRFFSISGKFIAHQERLCDLDDDEHEELLAEFIELEEKLGAITKLSEHTINLKTLTSSNKFQDNQDGWYLVKITRESIHKPNTITVESFSNSELEPAFQRLKDNDNAEYVFVSVLISAKDAAGVADAYPNYFGDAIEFTSFLSAKKKLYNRFKYNWANKGTRISDHEHGMDKSPDFVRDAILKALEDVTL